MLSKIINRTFVPAIPGDPGHPGSPRLPGYTARVCGPQTSYSTSGGGLSSGDLEEIKEALESGEGVRIQQARQSTTTTKTTSIVCRTVRYAAVAAIPPRAPIPEVPEKFLLDYQLGWNARAVSLFLLKDSGRYTFKVPVGTSGAIVGLTSNPQNTGFGDIRHGFYIASGQIKIYESGQEISSHGYSGDATYSIERRHGRIIYKVGSTVVRETTDDRAAVSLSAALYSGGDQVIDADIEQWSDGAAEMSFTPMQMFAGTEAYAVAELAFEPMQIQAFALNDGSASMAFEPMQVFASDAAGYSFVTMAFEPMGVFADGTGVTPPYAICEMNMMPMTMAAVGSRMTVGTAGMSFMPMDALGSEGNYGAASISFMPMTVEAYGELESDVGYLFSDFFCFDSTSQQTSLFAVMTSDMQVSAIVAVQTLKDAPLSSSMSATSSHDASALLYALLESTLMAGQIDGQQQPRTVWALNTDINGATRYEGYDFNSFAELDGVYYGAKSDGLYRLDGRDDNGQDVDSRVNFGRLNFGTLTRKALPYLYAGVSSDGNLVLKVTADGQTYHYNLRHNTEQLKAHRFELGRGLRASYYDVELIGEGGTAFDMTDIEFFPLEISRRL